MYLSTVLANFLRYIITWKLCTMMRAEDVTDTLDLALNPSGCDRATVFLSCTCDPRSAAKTLLSGLTLQTRARVGRSPPYGAMVLPILTPTGSFPKRSPKKHAAS